MIHTPLLAASVLSAIGAAWVAFAGDVATTAAALAVMAAGTGGIIPLADTRTIELAGSDRNRFGRARAFGSAAFIGGAVVTGVLVSGHSPNALFALFVPLLLVTGFASYRLLAPGPADDVARARRAARPGFSARGFVGLLGRPGLFALLVGTTLVWTAVAALMTFIGIRVANLGGDLAIIGLISSGSALVEVPIMLAFPAFARRLGVGRLVVLGAAAFALRAVLWAFAPSPAVALLVSPLGGVGFAFFYVGIVTFIARAVPAEAQATAQGVYSGMTFSLGSVVGTAVAGALAPVLGLPGLFLAAGAATFLGTLVVARGVTVAGRSLRADAARPSGPLVPSESR